MDQSEISELLNSLKTQTEENEGEVGYWGPPLKFTLRSHAAPETLGNPSKKNQLRDLREITIGNCQRCPLARSRTKLVFGVGNPEARVMFIGEGPGYDEDKIGDPFVGKAGQLLDRILAAIQLDRTQVYIANIVKCHPLLDPSQPEKRGNDRPPTPEEIQTCYPFLIEQIRIIDPRIIVALGATAARTLLGQRAGITQLRGQIKEVPLVPDRPPVPVLPTYHPAALLRDESLKKPVWDDMKKLRSILAL